MHTNNNSTCIDVYNFKIDTQTKASLNYSWKDFISELLCLHKLKLKNRWCERVRNRFKLFDEHHDSFKAETDWLHIVSSIREFQELKQQVKEIMEQNRIVVEAYQQLKYLDSSMQFESNFNSQSRLRFSTRKDSEESKAWELEH